MGKLNFPLGAQLFSTMGPSALLPQQLSPHTYPHLPLPGSVLRTRVQNFPSHRWVSHATTDKSILFHPPSSQGPHLRGNLAYPFPGLGYWCLKALGTKDRKRKKQTVTEPSWVSLKFKSTIWKQETGLLESSLVKQGEGLVVLNHKWTQKEGGVVDKQTQLTDYNSSRRWDSEAYRVSEMMGDAGCLKAAWWVEVWAQMLLHTWSLSSPPTLSQDKKARNLGVTFKYFYSVTKMSLCPPTLSPEVFTCLE